MDEDDAVSCGDDGMLHANTEHLYCIVCNREAHYVFRGNSYCSECVKVMIRAEKESATIVQQIANDKDIEIKHFEEKKKKTSVFEQIEKSIDEDNSLSLTEKYRCKTLLKKIEKNITKEKKKPSGTKSIKFW